MWPASTLILGVALWSAGTSLLRHKTFGHWIPTMILTAGGYAIIFGIALVFRAGLTP